MDPEALGREYDKIANHWQEPFLQTNGLVQFEKAIRFQAGRSCREAATDHSPGLQPRLQPWVSRYKNAPCKRRPKVMPLVLLRALGRRYDIWRLFQGAFASHATQG
jgi:hypothetical protein